MKFENKYYWKEKKSESSLNSKPELSVEHSWIFAMDTKSFPSFQWHSYHYHAFFPTEMTQWKDHFYTKDWAIRNGMLACTSADQEVK